MNRDNEKHFGLRVDGDILAKFRYVCGYVGRSANSQIIQLMLKFIADYEKEHGKIDLDEIQKSDFVKVMTASGLSDKVINNIAKKFRQMVKLSTRR